MEKISKEDVEHVAELSRIEFKKQEIEKFTEELEAILTYFSELENAPTATIELKEQTKTLKNVMRADRKEDGLSIEKVLANAPQKENSFFKVPTIFD